LHSTELNLLNLIKHVRESYFSNFVCLVVLALQRDMSLNWMMIYVPLIGHFF